MWWTRANQPHHNLTTHTPNCHTKIMTLPPPPQMMTSAPTTAYFVDNDDDDDDNDDDDDDDDVDDVDWEAEARDIQNRMSRAVGTTDREARHSGRCR